MDQTEKINTKLSRKLWTKKCYTRIHVCFCYWLFY